MPSKMFAFSFVFCILQILSQTQGFVLLTTKLASSKLPDTVKARSYIFRRLLPTARSETAFNLGSNLVGSSIVKCRRGRKRCSDAVSKPRSVWVCFTQVVRPLFVNKLVDAGSGTTKIQILATPTNYWWCKCRSPWRKWRLVLWLIKYRTWYLFRCTVHGYRSVASRQTVRNEEAVQKASLWISHLANIPHQYWWLHWEHCCDGSPTQWFT